MRLPPGVDGITVGRVRAFARPEAREWVVSTLEGGSTLHDAASADPAARTLRGRGPVPLIPRPDGWWVVRHYWRGGAMERLLVDRYLRLGEPRPVSEARWSREADRRGIPTPRVMAGAIYPSGPFYRADLVTEYVPDSRDLAAILFGREEGDEAAAWSDLRADALRAAGELVVQAAEAGLFHPDLNSMNVLLARSDDGLDSWLIDLDRCRLDVAGPDLVEATMARRLERSLHKLEGSTGRPLSADEWEAFRAPFHIAALPPREAT